MSTEASAPQDPYATLGIERTASKDQIKKAYYERAKEHHPDAGGGEDAFLLVKVAYETLIDDKKRQFFDEFGVVPGSAEAEEVGAGYQAIRILFLELLKTTSPEALKKLDVIARIRRQLEELRKKNEQKLKSIEECRAQFNSVAEILSAKLKNTDPKQPNVFQQSVQEALDECSAQQKILTRAIAVQARAVKILKSFTFEFDKEPLAGFTFAGVTFDSTGYR